MITEKRKKQLKRFVGMPIMWTDEIGGDGNEDEPTLKEKRALAACQPKNDEEARYFTELEKEAWIQTTYRKDDEVEKMTRDADAGKKEKKRQMKGTESTRAKAAERHKEIRKVYADIKRIHPDDKRSYLIAKTVEQLQGKRKEPRQNYGLRTVEKATRGL